MFSKVAKNINKKINELVKKADFHVNINDQKLKKEYETSIWKSKKQVTRWYLIYLEEISKQWWNKKFIYNSEDDCNLCQKTIEEIFESVFFVDDKLVTIYDLIKDEPDSNFIDDKTKVNYKKVIQKLDSYIKENYNNLEKWQAKLLNANTIENNTAIKTSSSKVCTFYHFAINKSVQEEYNNKIRNKINNVNLDRVLYLKKLINTYDKNFLEKVLKDIDKLYKWNDWKWIVETLIKIHDNVSKYGLIYLYKFADNDILYWLENKAFWKFLKEYKETDDFELAELKYLELVDPTKYKQKQNKILTEKQLNDFIKYAEKEWLKDEIFSRRIARINDLSVNEVIWINRKLIDIKDNKLEFILKKQLKDNIKETIKDIDNIQKINYEDLKKLLKNAKNVEIFVDDEYLKDRKAIMTTSDSNKSLFRYGNSFCLIYENNLADSTIWKIFKKVENAGGNINSSIVFSLAWYHKDDYDLHLLTPSEHIYYWNKVWTNFSLDVDMNVNNPVCEPVENIYYTWWKLKDGVYTIYVHNYKWRSKGQCEKEKEGFQIVVKIEDLNYLKILEYKKNLSNDEKIEVLKFTVENWKITKVEELINSISVKPKLTGRWMKVLFITKDPEHFNKDDASHLLFVVDDEIKWKFKPFLHDYIKKDLYKYSKILQIISEKEENMIEVNKWKDNKDILVGYGVSKWSWIPLLIKINNKIYQLEF